MRLILALTLLVACPEPVSTPDDTGDPVDVVLGSSLVADAQNIDATMSPVLETYGVPALAGAVVDSDGIFALGVAGNRQAGGTDAATVRDRWHLGSNTKAMTSTLVAVLVNDGVIEYDTTVEEIWPDVHESWTGATLEQLVTHQSGATGSIGGQHPDIWSAMWAERDSRAGRAAMVTALTSRPQDATRNSFTYSNAGYIIAGAMLEERTGETWEALMEEHLFAPAGMDECGFGAPQGEQPWGHSGTDGSPVDPATVGADNPPALGPAGTVHCSLASWGQFVALHLRGANGDESFLPTASFERMHTPIGTSGYAHGWGVGTRPWADGKTLSHRGSNVMWIADMWLAPERDRAFLAVSNSAHGDAGTAVDQGVLALITADPQRE